MLGDPCDPLTPGQSDSRAHTLNHCISEQATCLVVKGKDVCTVGCLVESRGSDGAKGALETWLRVWPYS